MGLFDWLFGPEPTDRECNDDVQPPPSWGGAGPDIAAGRTQTQTEQDLRRVQSQYNRETDSFDGGKERAK